MTTFQYTLTLDDSEMIALTYAIDFYMAECIRQIEGGAGTPYRAHLSSLRKIRERRHENARQTSGSTIGKASHQLSSMIGFSMTRMETQLI